MKNTKSLILTICNIITVMDSKYSQKNLRTTIASQRIQDKALYYYSLAKKQQKSLSFMKNQRLLVLNFDQGKLFYVNQTKNLPFRNQAPSPKSEYAMIQSTNIQHASNTNEIQFSFTYNKEKYLWKFIFQTNQLADEWIKMIDYQKYSQSVKQRDLKSLNKTIFQMPKEKEKTNDIVKQPQRNIPNDQSRYVNQSIVGKSRLNQPSPQDSRYDRNKSKKWSDWNQRFFVQRNILTLYEYEQAAIDSFYRTINKDDPRQDNIRNYENQSFIIKIANRYTLNAKKLKIEFRNYQFILQATNKKFIVGVPLACLIEFQNVVGLVKAKFPDKVEAYVYDNTIKDQLHQLQRYTRVKNRVLQFSTILSLQKFYTPNSRQPLLYLENTNDYLPINLQFPQQLTLIRPQYMLDNVDYLVFTGPQDKIAKSQNRQLRQLGAFVTDKAKQFSSKFYLESFPVIKITELKNIFHDQGLNLKFLPYVYNNCPNNQVKKYIYTAMTAKIVKDYIYQTIVKLRMSPQNISLSRIVQETLSILLQGNNNKSNELWKEISLIFKRKYNIILNHKEILPGFFFNSILQLIPCKINIEKINKKKKIFEQMKIIDRDFIKDLLPKVKSYYRFLPENIQQLKFEAKQYIKSPQVSKKILNELFNPRDKKYEVFYQFGNNDEWMIQYLSLYYPPQNIATEQDDRINFLYDRINEEPPSYFTMSLTKSYLQWCNKKQNTKQFIRVFEKAMEIADYWLQEIHPMRSDLFEILSDYFSVLGSNEDMLRYMKDSLTICIKFWGNNTIQAGLKQYQLADRYLRAGKKKQSIQYFNKAKQNIQKNKLKTNKHGLSLMKLASIYLSDLQYEKAIQFARQSIKSFEDYQKKVNSNGIFNQPYKIKSYQILARVYQICDSRTQYKQLALNCARKFNTTKNKQVFEQMVRICLASSIFKSNNDRCESFLKLVQSIISDSRQQAKNYQSSLQDLMGLSDDTVIMQRFILKFQIFERSLFELNQKKRHLGEDNQEFIIILKNIINVVGYEYIKGLVDEKISTSV